MNEKRYNFEKERKLLEGNVGFDGLHDLWAPLVTTLGIKSVIAQKLDACPFCDNPQTVGADAAPSIGQYLYYSTLCHLRKCSKCSLIYSDARIDKSITQAHFEIGYKEESYFKNQRKKIFNTIVDVVCSNARRGAKVLDCGGATGILAEMLRDRRPDLEIIISDISFEACEKARSKGFRAIQGSLSDLLGLSNSLRPSDLSEFRKLPDDTDFSELRPEQFDFILLIDVLYYEDTLRESLEGLKQMLNSSGMLIYRGPNKYLIMRVASLLSQIFLPFKSRSLAKRIPFFNPEHLYVLRGPFLSACFRDLGFQDVRLLPSPSLQKNSMIMVFYASLLDTCALFCHKFLKLVISPSYLLIARKVEHP